MNQLPVGYGEQNNRDTLHLSLDDSGSNRAVTSSNSVSSESFFIACKERFCGLLATHPRYGAATNLRGKSEQKEKYENQRSNLRKLLGRRRVGGVASNGQASKEIFGVEVKTDGSANDTGDTPLSKH